MRVIDFHDNEILRGAVIQIRSQFILKGAISVRSLPEIVAIDPDLAISIDAVEIYEHQLTFAV